MIQFRETIVKEKWYIHALLCDGSRSDPYLRYCCSFLQYAVLRLHYTLTLTPFLSVWCSVGSLDISTCYPTAVEAQRCSKAT